MSSSSSSVYPRFLKATHFPPSNYEEMMVDKLPSKKLELEFIHGASKKGCKGNYFHINDENKLIYPSAACGVVYSPKENKQSIFRRHDDDVVTIAKHPNQYIFASGQIGKDDMIYVWDSHQPEKEPIAKLDTHLHFKNGGVLVLCFSNSGDLIATIGGNDTNSTLLLYNWKKNELIGSTKCLSSEVYDLQFTPDDSQLFVCGKKTLKIYNTKDLSSKSGVFGSKGTLQNTYSMCFNMKTQECYVGVEDGSIYLFKDGKVIQTFNAHNGSVLTLCPLYHLNDLKYNYGFVSGGKDGIVKLWKFNSLSSIECYQSFTINGHVKNVTHSIHDDTIYASKANGDLYMIDNQHESKLLLISHFGSTLKQLWGLDTFKELPLFVTCSDDSRVIVWNAESRKHVALLKLATTGCTGLELRGVCVSPNNTHIAITSKEGHLFVYGFNLETFTEEPIFTRRDSNEEIATLSYNSDGTLLALGSHDNFIYLYSITNLNEYKYIGKLIGHSSFITHLDISKCGNYLKSNSGDYEILLWDLQCKKQLSNCSHIEEIEWNNITCPLGWTVRGIWKQEFDGTDINTCHVDFENSLVIAGEDTTMISLYHYPCSIIKPFGYSYIGHCSHVTNVRFLHYNTTNTTMNNTNMNNTTNTNMNNTNTNTNERVTKLLTCGGGDLTIFQWNLIDNTIDQMNNTTITTSIGNNNSIGNRKDGLIGGGLYNPKTPRTISTPVESKSPRNGIGGSIRPLSSHSPRSKSVINSSNNSLISGNIVNGSIKSSPRSLSVLSNTNTNNTNTNTNNTTSNANNTNNNSIVDGNVNDSKLKIVLQYEKCKTILQVDLNNSKDCTFEHLIRIVREDFDLGENDKLDLLYHDTELECDIHIRNDRHVQTCYDSFKKLSNNTMINILLK